MRPSQARSWRLDLALGMLSMPSYRHPQLSTHILGLHDLQMVWVQLDLSKAYPEVFVPLDQTYVVSLSTLLSDTLRIPFLTSL